MERNILLQGSTFAVSISIQYLSSIDRAIHSIQDADGCLLGARAHEGSSAAMGYHREAAGWIYRFRSGQK
jgi:hypothetical protein